MVLGFYRVQGSGLWDECLGCVLEGSGFGSRELWVC